MEIIGQILFELFAEIAGQILIELGWAGAKEALGRTNHRPILAAIGFLVLGGVCGWAWLWIHPGRVVSGAVLPGISLVLAPIAAGAAMQAWGTFRRRRGHATTNLATFLGGATFAFAVAIVRFFGIR